MLYRELLFPSERNEDFWNLFAAALLQASNWLRGHPSFVDLEIVPPPGSEEMVRNLALEGAELDDVPGKCITLTMNTDTSVDFPN